MKYLKTFLLLTFLLTAQLTYSQKVGLVLSGGGAKGLSHIGVIKALEENNIPIDYITGTSMGAIVGGLYAIGYSVDDMITLFSSPEFQTWYTGASEEEFTNFSQKMDAVAEMISFKFDFEESSVKMFLPTNVVPTYQMDLAFLQLFAAASAAANNDFDNLLVPFRCVATDINHKKMFVAKKGDLGTAIRASMTFPLYFKPIVIDSLLLFDGGMYNNFPQDVMVQDFNPDFIVGSKCANNALKADETDLILQLENMVMQNTDYSISDEQGVLIESKFTNINLMDFKKILELVDTGYYNTLAKIDEIKGRISRSVTPEELNEKREAFKKKFPELEFNWLNVTGSVNQKQVDYIKQVVRGTKRQPFDFTKLKNRYFKIIGSGAVSTLFPTASMDTTSGYFDANFRVVPAPRFKLAIGGNISSSSAQEGYVGLDYKYWRHLLTTLTGNLYYGRLYSSALIGFRQDIPISPTIFYEAYGIYNSYDYYSGDPDIFIPHQRPSYLKENDYHFRANIGVALTGNAPLKLGFTTGTNTCEYYQSINFDVTDIPDKSKVSYYTFSSVAERNTLNSSQFPTKGWRWLASIRYINANEMYEPGTTSSLLRDDRVRGGVFATRLFSEKYFAINKHMSIGVLTDAVYSTEANFSNYLSTVLMAPAFQPTIHSKTIFIPEYRADSYLGAGAMPIFSITEKLFLKGGLYAFAPYREFFRKVDNTTSYGKRFNKLYWMGCISAVWESPLGPLSLSVNYYDKRDTQLYFVFNFGFLLFNRSGIEY